VNREEAAAAHELAGGDRIAYLAGWDCEILRKPLFRERREQYPLEGLSRDSFTEGFHAAGQINI
jgi:hypothetical protein